MFGVRPYHGKTDVHLLSGFAAALFACGGAARAYFLPFEETKGLLTFAIVG